MSTTKNINDERTGFFIDRSPHWVHSIALIFGATDYLPPTSFVLPPPADCNTMELRGRFSFVLLSPLLFRWNMRMGLGVGVLPSLRVIPRSYPEPEAPTSNLSRTTRTEIICHARDRLCRKPCAWYHVDDFQYQSYRHYSALLGIFSSRETDKVCWYRYR